MCVEASNTEMKKARFISLRKQPVTLTSFLGCCSIGSSLLSISLPRKFREINYGIVPAHTGRVTHTRGILARSMYGEVSPGNGE
jgi:hypothetical protein